MVHFYNGILLSDRKKWVKKIQKLKKKKEMSYLTMKRHEGTKNACC